MSKGVLRKLLILWAMLLIGQFLLAAAVIYQSLMTGVPLLNALLSMQPVLAGASLMLFLITWLQYKNRP
ncbi:hypothetical protein [Asticcacaulis taihuensis]|jgi:hypothetical protein|uniref:Uncharacterized protein n=1 Tax=Asticcacaulis taihuensis TaxID=260084 RepID=A0A1G4TC96_9CAUL|nr:hypothetical protein [Asticcacaulis taihuensis]SCW79010.1 hypothetical protein SAMN02927928_3442 [Asticcacaulis taihuensis]